MYQTKVGMSTGVHANRIPKVTKSRSGGPIPAFASRFGGIFANVGIAGSLANTGFQRSFGFDIRFATPRPVGSECLIHPTGGTDRAVSDGFAVSLGWAQPDFCGG